MESLLPLPLPLVVCLGEFMCEFCEVDPIFLVFFLSLPLSSTAFVVGNSFLQWSGIE